MEVLLDTNFIVSCIRQKIQFISFLKESFNKILVPEGVVREIKKIKQDKTLEQVKNVACLKGIQKASYAMPDAHQGYGFSIGGVAAFDMEEGVISPGGVGYDINCGVRLLRTELKVNDVLSKRKQLLEGLYKEVPAGVGKGGITKVTKDVLLEVLSKGAKWAINEGYGTEEDLQRTEEYGNMKRE